MVSEKSNAISLENFSGTSLGCYQTAGNEGETAFYLEFCKTLTQSPLSLCVCMIE